MARAEISGAGRAGKCPAMRRPSLPSTSSPSRPISARRGGLPSCPRLSPYRGAATSKSARKGELALRARLRARSGQERASGKEAKEELLDAIVYAYLAILKLSLRTGEGTGIEHRREGYHLVLVPPPGDPPPDERPRCQSVGSQGDSLRAAKGAAIRRRRQEPSRDLKTGGGQVPKRESALLSTSSRYRGRVSEDWEQTDPIHGRVRESSVTATMLRDPWQARSVFRPCTLHGITPWKLRDTHNDDGRLYQSLPPKGATGSRR